MTDDFKPSAPALKGSVSRGGDIDWKDRSTQLSMWVQEKDGKQYLSGKVGGDKDKRVVLFVQEGWKLVQSESEDW